MAGRRDAGSGMCEVVQCREWMSRQSGKWQWEVAMAVGGGNGSWNRQWEEAVAVESGSMKWQWEVAVAVGSGMHQGLCQKAARSWGYHL